MYLFEYPKGNISRVSPRLVCHTFHTRSSAVRYDMVITIPKAYHKMWEDMGANLSNAQLPAYRYNIAKALKQLQLPAHEWEVYWTRFLDLHNYVEVLKFLRNYGLGSGLSLSEDTKYGMHATYASLMHDMA